MLGLFKKNYEKFFLLALLLISLFFATYKLSESPPFWYDEGIYDQVAINLAKFEIQGIQVAPNEFVSADIITGGFTFLYPISWSFKYFGVGVLQARAVMVAFLILLVFTSYFLANNLFKYKTAALTALSIATFPIIYGNGKNVLGEVPGLFFLMLFLFFVNKIERGGRRISDYALAGLAGGLCVATKPLFLVLLPAIAAGFIFKRKKINFDWQSALIALLFFLSPIILWLQTQFQSVNALFGVLGYYSNPYGLSNLWEVIISNFQRFFTELNPIYFFILFITWAVAIGVRIKKKREISLTEIISFFFSLLVLLAYLRTFGWYRYFFPANLMALFYFPASLGIIAEYMKNKFAWVKSSKPIKLLPILIVCLLIAFHFYQLGFNSWVADHYHNKKTEKLITYFENFNSAKSIFIYNVPEIAIFLPTDNYYQYLELTKSLFIGREQLEKINIGIPDQIIIGTNLPQSVRDKFILYKIKDSVHKYIVFEKINIMESDPDIK